MNNPYMQSFQCTVCKSLYAVDALLYTCPKCGEVGTLDMVYDFDAMRATLTRAALSASHDFSMWRYRDLLPLAPGDAVPPLPVGWTPLVPAPRLAQAAGVADLWIKDDGRNPTASFKDRASVMVVAHALAIGAEAVTTASTGNAAAALAGLCASAGLRTVIFVPASAPEAKIAQLLVYGAQVFLVQGSYDDAFDLCMQAAARYGWYCRNTGINPYTTEGKKTAAFEIAEQLDWNVPDAVVVSVGDGSIIGGIHKGFADLHALGWIDHLPRLIGVQAEGSAALATAWRAESSGTAISPIAAHTIADSIASDLPRDRVKAMRAVRETGGVYVTVNDEAILAAIPAVARGSGVFMEPAGAAVWAGLQQAIREGAVRSHERVVLLGTGNGLKDVRAAMRTVGAGQPVGKQIGDLDAILMPTREGN